MLDLNKASINKYKNAYIKRESISNVEDVVPIYNRYDSVIMKFNKIHNRDIDFDNANDRNQAAFYDAFEMIIDRKNDFQYINTASTAELRDLFTLFELSNSKSDESEATELAKKVWDSELFSFISHSDIVKATISFLTPNRDYISEQLINSISQREDAHIVLPYILERVDKGFFTEEGYQILQDNIILSQNDKINNQQKQYSRTEIKNLIKNLLKASAPGKKNILNQIKEEDGDLGNGKYSEAEVKEKIKILEELLTQKKEDEDKYNKNIKTQADQLQQKQSFESMISSTKAVGAELEKIGQWSDSRDLQKVGAIYGITGHYRTICCANSWFCWNDSSFRFWNGVSS